MSSDATFFEFGLPPVGEHADFYAAGALPAHLLKIVPPHFEERYPGAFILAALVGDFFCLYHRTKVAVRCRQSIKRIVLEPVGPAKGRGYILMSVEIVDREGTIPMVESDFSERMDTWMEDRAKRISVLLGVPYARLPLGADA